MINPPYNKVKLLLIKQPFHLLLLYWIVLYLSMGIIFAFVYWVLDYSEPHNAISIINSKRCWTDFPHFSFATQATVGYGDFSPVSGLARLIAGIQAGIGIVLNALILGITTYKLIKHDSPIYFPSNLVYDPNRHTFWFRFINWDADDVRDVSFKVSAFQDFAGAYDVASRNVELDYSEASLVPSVHLFAIRTLKDEEQNNDSIGESVTDKNGICLSPLHISENTTVRLSLNGYFQTTGDGFSVNKDYSLKDIKCGQFDDVKNYEIRNFSRKDKVKYIKQRFDFNETGKTSEAKCRDCKLFSQGCPLDVRSEICDTEKSL